MDSIDRAILRHLQIDGRISNHELAQRVGLSPSPCLRRLRNLEAGGVIRGYGAILDRRSIGCAYEPLVWVTLTEITRTSMTEFETAVAAIDEVVEVLRMMGQPDYLLRVACADADAFETLYIDRLASLPFVQTLTSQLAMKVVVRRNELPIRTERSERHR
jgi:Lrp/AsnC family transcriptional regulator, leucine-responsive regulatory protein